MTPNPASRLRRRRRSARALAWAAAACATWLLAATPAAFAQDCDGVVQRSEEAYYAGQFDAGIGGLSGCLDSGDVAAGDLQDAYALLGRLHFAKGDQSGARTALRRLFEHAPSYRPDPAQEEPAYLTLVEDVRQQVERAAAERAQARRDSLARVQAENAPAGGEVETPRRRSPLPFVLAGVGAAAAGAALLLLGGGDDGPPQNACNGPTTLSDVEPNSPSLPQVLSASNGPPIQLSGTVTLEPALDEDFFSVRINSAGITVSLTNLTADAHLYFGDFDEVHLASERPGTEDEVISANLPPGAYFIHVFPNQFGVSSISYTLNVVGDLDGCSSFNVRQEVPAATALPAGAQRWLPARGRSATACEAPDVALRPGWNDIRNTSGRDIEWAAVAGFNQVERVLWRLDGTWQPDDRFRPDVTYRLFNAGELGCLRVPPPGAAPPPQPAGAPTMELRASIDDATHSSVSISFEDGDGSRAPGLEPAPAREGAVLHLAIREEAARGAHVALKSVTRLTGEAGYAIPLSLEAPAGAFVRLRLEGWAPPAGEVAFLVETESARVHPIGGTGTVHLVAEEATTSLALVMGQPHFVSAYVRSLGGESGTSAEAWPNPFRDQARIRYQVDESREPQPVRVEIVNLLGQRVRTLVDETQPSGMHEVVWDGRDASGAAVASAPYLCRVTAGGEASTFRLTLSR